MRVLMADGDPDVRAALRLLLTHELGMQVVGEAADATDLRAQAPVVRPNLVLLDWALLGGGARDVIADLLACSPCPTIVVLSAHPETRPHALAAGADAFVSKTDAPAQLVTTLRALPAPAADATGSTREGATGPSHDDADAPRASRKGDV